MKNRISLNGDWDFCEKGTGIWKNGCVPGCVQSDLMRQAELEDPFYGINEPLAHGLEEKEWVYRKTFNFTTDAHRYDSILLVFEGVDTAADIYLNGCHLGYVENMFIPHTFGIEPAIQQGINSLEVHFSSDIRTARARQAASSVDLKFCCDPAAPYIRKSHYSFGWDWSPRLLQTGLWRPVYIEMTETAEIRDPFFFTRKLDKTWAVVTVEAEVIAYDSGDMNAEIEIQYEGQPVSSKTVSVGMKGEKQRVLADFRIDGPNVWYPNGAGTQPMYDISIKLYRNGSLADERTFRSGIRTARLIREKDAEGESFIFEINGQKIFAKGANWVPADNLPSRLTREDYYSFIRAARDANMNMLMMWGGGVYEDPAFYEACDEYGIMIWQTFMFHYMQLPDHLDWFQEQIREEAGAVIKCLRNHPSIVLWCGECENGWTYDTEPKYTGNYSVEDIIPETLSRLDPSREYWRGTPWGGKDPNSMSEGDRHAYNVWLGWQDFDAYLKDTSRFVSEFGAHGMPPWKTLLSYTPTEELHFYSNTTQNHNKLMEGPEMHMRYMVGRLGFPRDFRSYCYLSQFNQAESVKIAVEHWRSRKFKTAGTLFWMFNDCWPCASWSCIDYYKRKKGLYYYARNFYAGLLPLLKHEDGKIVLNVVNDLQQPAEVEVRVAAYKLNGTRLGEKKFHAVLGANRNICVAEFLPDDFHIGVTPGWQVAERYFTMAPVEVNRQLTDSVFYAELLYNGQLYRNYLVFERYRTLELQSPVINVTVEGNGITIVSDVPAFGVFIEPQKDVELSDNCINLEPGRPIQIECSEHPGSLEVFSLADLRATM
jgi:beta-mannosidase